MFWLVVFCCLYTVILCNNDGSRLVHLSQGPVRGYKDPDEGIFSFYGIPYAKAPTGPERFKAPLPAPVWSDTFEAVDKGIVCPQSNLMGILPPSNVPQEDCLIANVYVPDTNKTNLPVLIIVHGGAYAMGWGNMFTPKKVTSTKKVISVTFNYRLGPHGFLCLGTKDAPGNAGMKDQVALFRWVKKNIRSFGGNPDDIILSGFSSGASAIDILILSKMTKGYFKKIIPESAGGLSPFNVQLDPIENAKIYAKLLKFDNVDDIEALENFYKTVPYELLNSGNVMALKNSGTVMAPCVERDIGEERFLDDSPVNILKSGDFEKLPTLYGFVDMDGLFRLPQFYHWKNEMNDYFADFLPVDLQFTNEYEKQKVAEQIKHFYFGDKLVGEETVLNYIYYFSDVLFAWPMLRSVKYQVEAGHDQIYLYQYSYFEDNAPFIPYTNVRGADHCAQTYGTLDGYWNNTIVGEKDVSEDIRQRKIYMKKIWLNFILTGKPIPEGSGLPEWPPVSFDLSPHMSINRTLELKGSLLKERRLFWEKIYDKYYRYPIPPVLPTDYKHLNDGKARAINYSKLLNETGK
ncbi:juvenile hormone esterase-like [Maniola jurtina]|uniref:juvenile hormone esterase-like n=1 Tax=Maniola jurtina TaxID=191418 RepID=UPI001E68FA46|nr:juvenile hormone esterase-like [Maniola jurtina]